MKSQLAFARSADANAHLRALQLLVHQKVASLPRQRIWFARLRALLLPVLYFLLYSLALLLRGELLWYMLLYGAMGASIVLIFLNLVHETVHNTLFRSKKLNAAFLYLFDLIGANSYIWKRRHIHLHHNFPNVAGWDSDIEQASLFRIFPHDPHKSIHKHQPRLLFLLYPFYLANWLLVRDFKDFFREKQIIRKITRIPQAEYYKLFFFKGIFIGYTLLLPLALGVSPLQAGGAFLLLLLTANAFALFVLLTPHTNTQNAFPIPDARHTLPESWLLHQFSTTNDVAGNSWWYRNVMANFNCHLAHHLFPRISYVYAPEVTQVIRDFARQHQIPYRVYPLLQALRFHYQLIRRNAIDAESFLEEDM